MEKQEQPSVDWSKLQETLDALPPEVRSRVAVPLMASSPTEFVKTLKVLRDQIDQMIEKIEEATGDHSSPDSGPRG